MQILIIWAIRLKPKQETQMFRKNIVLLLLPNNVPRKMLSTIQSFIIAWNHLVSRKLFNKNNRQVRQSTHCPITHSEEISKGEIRLFFKIKCSSSRRWTVYRTSIKFAAVHYYGLKALTATPIENWWNFIVRTATTANPAKSDCLAGEIKMLYEAARNTSTSALRTALQRSEYLPCVLLLALFRTPCQGGETWSKLACFIFRAHFLVCYCILNSKIAFQTLFYRADTDYCVCAYKTHGWDNVHSVAMLF